MNLQILTNQTNLQVSVETDQALDLKLQKNFLEKNDDQINLNCSKNFLDSTIKRVSVNIEKLKSNPSNTQSLIKDKKYEEYQEDINKFLRSENDLISNKNLDYSKEFLRNCIEKVKEKIQIQRKYSIIGENIF